MKRIVQHAKIVTIQRQIVEYICDRCGKVCGTRENPKQTRYASGSQEMHYCKKTCVTTPARPSRLRRSPRYRERS